MDELCPRLGVDVRARVTPALAYCERCGGAFAYDWQVIARSSA